LRTFWSDRNLKEDKHEKITKPLATGRLFGSTFNSSYALSQADFSKPHKPNQVIVKFKNDAFIEPETHLGPESKILHRFASGALLVEIPAGFQDGEVGFAENSASKKTSHTSSQTTRFMSMPCQTIPLSEAFMV
jgi:hypothetical protein